AGLQFSLERRIGNGRDHLVLGDGLTVTDIDAAEDAGPLGADGLPVEWLDLPVGGQGADESGTRDSREADFRRRAPAQNTPSDNCRHRDQQRQYPLFQSVLLFTILAAHARAKPMPI